MIAGHHPREPSSGVSGDVDASQGRGRECPDHVLVGGGTHRPVRDRPPHSRDQDQGRVGQRGPQRIPIRTQGSHFLTATLFFLLPLFSRRFS